MVTGAMVKELREKTGAGMVDCKNALIEAEGNIERAIEILREKGLNALSKKSGRIASEGVSYAYAENDLGIILEVNSETDFVAKNPEFVTFVEDVAKQIKNSPVSDVESLLAENWHIDKNITVEQALSQKIAIIGEKLSIRRFEKYQSENTIVVYIHGKGKVAVMLELSGKTSPALEEAGKNTAMQIAAMRPQFIDQSQISQEFIAKEREIETQKALAEGKPANIVDKVVTGRVNKNLKEICLNEQEYVKDGSLTVKAYLAQVSKEAGHPVEVLRFVRYETGEGIEKKEENFAEEVSKAMGTNL